MELLKQLGLIGLNQKEATIYLACLELASGTIQEIAKKSGVNRTTAYRVIENLKKRGLISSLSKSKKNVFIAEDVTQLQKDFEYRKSVFNDLIPQLRAITNVLPNKPAIRYYEGEENILKITMETTEYKDTPYYCWFDYESIPWYGEHFDKRYIDTRLRNRVFCYAITNRSHLAETYKARKNELREVRYYKDPKTKFDVDIYIYGKKKIAIINRKDLSALMIESREIYSMMKTIFLSNWEQLGE